MNFNSLFTFCGGPFFFLHTFAFHELKKRRFGVKIIKVKIQFLEILAMDVVELEEFLQNEYISTPLFEKIPSQEALGLQTKEEAEYVPHDYLYTGRDIIESWDEDGRRKQNIAAGQDNVRRAD